LPILPCSLLVEPKPILHGFCQKLKFNVGWVEERNPTSIRVSQALYPTYKFPKPRAVLEP
ncbi:hypothetical protein, partial [Aetokthonos hydrillicola]|uniref:hypothetical protein n=1 Tax=Aetokthonos hydrillicola TaxID=1550245 RepID=UPI001ABB566C